MSVFDYRRNKRQQLVAKGEPIDNNIDFSGRTNTDFTNKFVAKMKEMQTKRANVPNVLCIFIIEV